MTTPNCGIYEIVNLLSGKRYIGQSVNIAQRFRQHKHVLRKGIASEYLQHAWNKYGEAAFEFRIVCLCPREELSKREDLEAEKYNFRQLYNIREDYGGTNHSPETVAKLRAATANWWADPKGRVQMTSAMNTPAAKEARSKAGLNKLPATDETRAKMSANMTSERRAKISDDMKQQWAEPEYRKTQLEALTGRIVSDETKARMSAAGKKRFERPGERAKISAANMGRKHTDAAKRKMSDAAKGKKKSAEHCRKLSEASKCRPPISDETRRKISEAGKARYARPGERDKRAERAKAVWNSPGHREKVRKGQVEAFAKPEVKKRMSAAQKAKWARRKAAQVAIVLWLISMGEQLVPIVN